MTKKERNCLSQANPLPGVVQEKGVAESGEEVEDAQLVHLSTKYVLPALGKIGKHTNVGVKKIQKINQTSHISPESLNERHIEFLLKHKSQSHLLMLFYEDEE